MIKSNKNILYHERARECMYVNVRILNLKVVYKMNKCFSNIVYTQ